MTQFDFTPRVLVARNGYPIATPPDMTGNGGTKAWRVDLDALRRKSTSAAALVRAWVIEAPWAHPCWHSYLISCVTLAALPGYPAPRVYLPGATHEFIIAALDPEYPVILPGPFREMMPLNFAAQFIAESDADAAERVQKRAVELIVGGRLSPDTDFLREWARLWGDNMVRQ